jgi:hypothetical protein
MSVPFGRQRSHSAAKLLLDDPAYVVSVLREPEPQGRLARLRDEVCRLIDRFDARPICVPCRAPGCGRRATRCSVYRDSVRPVWWCDECDPYQEGATPGALRLLSRYLEAVAHVEWSGNGRRSDLRFLVRELARARGLPGRVGAAEAEAFFRAGPPAS